MLNPAVTSGVDLFINIVIVLVGFVTAVSLIDIRRTNKKAEKDA